MAEVKTALEALKHGKVLPLYLMVGEENFLRDQLVSEIRRIALTPPTTVAFNEDKFTAGEAEVEKVLAAARTLPMMGTKRLVWVRHAERWDALPAGADRAKERSPLDRLAEYASAPNPTTCLIITAQKLDGRRKLSLFAKKQGYFFACDPFNARALHQWTMDQFKERGKSIESNTVDLLLDLVGPDLTTTRDAIEKLCLFVGKGKSVDADTVSQCIARIRITDAWALVSAVGDQNLSSALQILGEIYDPRDRGLPLLGALAWSVRQLMRMKAALASGLRIEEAGRSMAIFQPARAHSLAEKVRSLHSSQLERWLLTFRNTDFALKSSKRPAHSILEDMLVQICAKTNQFSLFP